MYTHCCFALSHPLSSTCHTRLKRVPRLVAIHHEMFISFSSLATISFHIIVPHLSVSVCMLLDNIWMIVFLRIFCAFTMHVQCNYFIPHASSGISCSMFRLPDPGLLSSKFCGKYCSRKLPPSMAQLGVSPNNLEASHNLPTFVWLRACLL